MKSKILVYEDLPRFDRWVGLVLVGLTALTLLAGIAFLFIEIEAAYVFFGVTVFDGLLFWVIIPRRYQVFEDRVKIVLGARLAMNIPLPDIKNVKPVWGGSAVVYWGIKFATSMETVIEISRTHGMDIVISPSNPDTFIEQVTKARDVLVT